MYIAEIIHFLRATNGTNDVLRLAVCKLWQAKPAMQGEHASDHEDFIVARLSGRAETMAVDISALDTKLVTAKSGNKLYGMVYGNTSGMA